VAKISALRFFHLAMPSHSSTEAQMARSGYTKAAILTGHGKLQTPGSFALTGCKGERTGCLQLPVSSHEILSDKRIAMQTLNTHY